MSDTAMAQGQGTPGGTVMAEKRDPLWVRFLRTWGTILVIVVTAIGFGVSSV
jgi:hypothetical protein